MLVSLPSLAVATALCGMWLGLVPPPSLEQARDKEASVLRSERDALQTAVAEAQSAASAAEHELEANVDALAAELATLQAGNAAQERRLPRDSSAHSSATHERHLTEVMTQMKRWLTSRGTPFDGAPQPAELPEQIQTILRHIVSDGELRVEDDQPFFDARGDEHRGRIFRVGRIAAMRWDGTDHPLVTNEGEYQVVPGLAGAHRRLDNGEAIKVILQEPGAPNDVALYTGRSWIDTMNVGGPLMWVLLAFGGFGLLVALERAARLTIIHRRWAALRMWFEQTGPTQKAPPPLSEGWLIKPLLLIRGRESAGDAQTEDQITDSVLAIRDRVFARLSALALVATVAPLIGLLGTVSGMIKTFAVVTSHAQNDPQALAGGISEALLTTQFGLIIAIPGLVIHVFLTRVARRVLVDVEQTVLEKLHEAPLSSREADEQPSAIDRLPESPDDD